MVNMAEVRLRAELEKFKAEIDRLKQRKSLDIPTVRKDISLISLVLYLSGLGPRHQCRWKNFCPA